MDKLEQFRLLLENVSDSYDDFVQGGLIEAEGNDDYINRITDYILSNPTATTSEIIQFESEEVFGIKPNEA